MQSATYDSNCDLVIEMQEMGVGIEEILQYARGTLSPEEIRHLLARLGQMAVLEEVPVEQYYG